VFFVWTTDCFFKGKPVVTIPTESIEVNLPDRGSEVSGRVSLGSDAGHASDELDVGSGGGDANGLGSTTTLEGKDDGDVIVAEDSTALSVTSLVEDLDVMPFKVYAPEVLKNNPIKVNTVKGNASSFGAITMFAERGLCSGHYYQPPMNHRQVNFSSYTESHAVVDRMTVPPLIESMVRPGQGAFFSVGNLMSLSCYEVVVSDSPLYPAIESLAPLTLKSTDEVGDKSTSLTGCIRGFRAKVLTPSAWKRTLEVFGWKPNPEYPKGVHVSSGEIVWFLEKLASFNLSTSDGLKALIEDRKLGWLYTVVSDEEMAIYDQLNIFFALIRATVPFRIGAFDGRHRFSLCCYFATGFFKPVRDFTLERGAYEDMVKATVPDYEGAFESCAVFQNQLFYVSQPNDAVLDNEHMSNLRKSGVTTTHNQMLTIDANWRTLITEFVQYCIAHNVHDQLEKFNFTNFWEPAQIALLTPDKAVAVATPGSSPGRKRVAKTKPAPKNTIRDNHRVLWTAFQNFLNDADATRMPIILGDKAKYSGNETLALIHPDCFKTFGHLMGKLRMARPPGGVGRELGVFSALVKLCCDDLDAVVKLRDLLEMKPSSFPQGTSWEPLKDYFRSMNFLSYWIFGLANVIGNQIALKVIVEKGILKIVRSAKGNEFIGKDVHDHYGKFPNAEKAGLFGTIRQALSDSNVKLRRPIEVAGSEKLKTKKPNSRQVVPVTEWKDTDLGLPRHSNMHTDKVTFSCMATLVRDIMDGILKYGWDPKIPRKGDSNHALELYLR
jgi:hypothetical protein